ncbi:MAG: aldehyde ferredoxin oxidoreductase family protein [Thermoplasmata archaeon]
MESAFTGKVLEIDLTEKTYEVTDLNTEDAKMFIGGKGLGIKMLWDRTEGGTDPLGPDNPLMFVTGPLTGLAAPTSGRYCVVTKSPETGIFNDSHCGGYFGPALKKAGYDVLVITGISKEPCSVIIQDDDVTFQDASELWGNSTFETTRALRKTYDDDKLRVASIGPAGENLVKYAMINIDTHDQKERGGQAGRGGAGAVMGSKNLKAVAVKGTGKLTQARPEEFKEAAKEAHRITREDDFIPNRTKYGTPIWINPMNEYGILPTKNFSRATFEKADNISGETMEQDIVEENVSCYGCPIRCGKHSVVKEGKYKGTRLEGPEYELLVLLGSNCCMGDLGVVSKASLMVDELGLDGISTGNVLGWAMECFERGILTKEDFGGLEPRFGEPEPYLKLIEMIAHREGVGDTLAEGVMRAAEKVGQGTGDFAMHCKGMEFPGYEPRGSPGMGLAYATSDRGACHQRAWTVRAELEMEKQFSADGRAKLVRDTQDERAAAYSLVMCDFVPFGVPTFVKMFNSATGFDLTEEEYLDAGERIWNLARMYAVREGISRKDDRIPQRLMEPLPDGPTKGNAFTQGMFDEMLDEYYGLRGWDENGVPTGETLERLRLNFTKEYIK